MSIGEYLKSVFSLEGKTILISGATGGIGSAISRGLAAAGAEAALCARNQQKCRELADEISAHGGAATAHALDISDLDSIHRCVDEVMQRYGKIDVLFNVAGINRREGLLDVEPETYDRIMDTNLKGVFFLSQAVAREMYRRRSGNIINIGSHNDTGMLGGCSVYGASKSGVVALTRSMAVDPLQRDQPRSYPDRSDAGDLAASYAERISARADRHGPSGRAGRADRNGHSSGLGCLLVHDGTGVSC